MRADFRHVFANLPQVRDGAQGAHNAAGAQRIGYGLLQTIAFTEPQNR